MNGCPMGSGGFGDDCYVLNPFQSQFWVWNIFSEISSSTDSGRIKSDISDVAEQEVSENL